MAALELPAGETEAAQQLQRLSRHGLVGQQQDALLLPVGVQQVCLRFRHLLAQRALYLLPYGEGGQRAGGDVAPSRLCQLQRDIQAPPGCQGGLLAAELGLLGGEAVYVRRQFIDVLGRFQL